MKGLRKVVWAEGMFLGQQHFQMWDNYIESYQSLQIRSISPMAWGLLQLEIDQEALENQQFRISFCQAIFPDGRLVSYEASEAEPLSKELTGGFSEKIELYLCLPANRTTKGISGYHNTGQLCAWYADYRQIADENDPSREREVMLGHPNLMLVTGDESRENFTSIKIAEIVNDGDGEYTFVDNYIPPIVNIQASDYLSAMLVRIIELFSAKIRVLNERRKQYSSGIAEFGHNDVANFLVLQALSGAIPILQHFRKNVDLHPEQIYQLLSNVIGGLCPFSLEMDVHSIPIYQHNNLTKVFTTLERLLRELVDVAMPTKVASIKLTKESDALYSVDNIESAVLASSTLFLAVLLESDNSNWVGQFERMAKVGARVDIEMIVASALPGVNIRHMQRPPSNLPIKSGFEYYRLDPNGTFWDRVASERTLGLFIPRDFIKAKIEIVTVKEN